MEIDRLGNRCGDMENCAMNAPPAPPPMLLLVDDDPAVLASLIFSLELEGFAVDAFDSGETVVARNRLARHACLVLDYRLSGIDGLSLLKLLRERGETCPAVIITSNPTRAMRQRTTEAGAVLIEKPLLGDSLTTAIRQLIHGPSPATRNRPD